MKDKAPSTDILGVGGEVIPEGQPAWERGVWEVDVRRDPSRVTMKTRAFLDGVVVQRCVAATPGEKGAVLRYKQYDSRYGTPGGETEILTGKVELREVEHA